MNKNKKSVEDFEELYNRIIKKWPDTISVNDGRATTKTAYFFPKLSNAYYRAEDSAKDNLGGLMVWTIFGVLHDQAKKLLKGKGNKIIYLNKIDTKKIKRRFLKNLQVKGWKEDKKFYQHK